MVEGEPPGSLKAAPQEWSKMSDAQKKPFVDEAAANKQRKGQLVQAKKPPRALNPYTAFVKKHGAAAHAKATAEHKGDKKAAFLAATKALAKQWKTQKKKA